MIHLPLTVAQCNLAITILTLVYLLVVIAQGVVIHNLGCAIWTLNRTLWHHEQEAKYADPAYPGSKIEVEWLP